VLDLQRDPPNIQTHDLGAVDTLLVRRKGHHSAAFDAFLAVLQRAGPPSSAEISRN
jgi:hypothetical protein